MSKKIKIKLDEKQIQLAELTTLYLGGEITLSQLIDETNKLTEKKEK